MEHLSVKKKGLEGQLAGGGRETGRDGKMHR